MVDGLPSGDQLRGMLDTGAARLEGRPITDVMADAAALATGGWGAVELEATAPAPVVEVLDPASSAEIEALRRSTHGELERPHVGIHHLVAGPDGQMISGHNR